MAVTLTVAELSAALRLGDTDVEAAQATRLLDYSIEAVSRHLGDAYTSTPSAIVNEAAIRLCGYLFDAPTASKGMTFANALRNSGAAVMLLPYRVHRAGSTAEVAAAALSGSDANPVTGMTFILFGTAMPDVTTTAAWVLTSLNIPNASVIGVEVTNPNGVRSGIELQTNILPTDALVVVGEMYDFPSGQPFAIGRAAGGLAFVSLKLGVHTLTIYLVETS